MIYNFPHVSIDCKFPTYVDLAGTDFLFIINMLTNENEDLVASSLVRSGCVGESVDYEWSVYNQMSVVEKFTGCSS